MADINDSPMIKRCKNCSLLLANHSLIRLELCKGELDAKRKLIQLKTKTQQYEIERRKELERLLGE